MTRAPTTAQPVTRRMRGFEPASQLLVDRVRVAGEKRGFATTRLLTHWAEIAGADLALITRPVKIGYAREGFGATLTLLTAAAQAPIVQMQLAELRARVNACYGYNAIARISLTQTASTGFAEGQAVFLPTPVKQTQPDPAIAAEAASTASGVQDNGLRHAIEQITANFLARSQS